MTLQHLYTFRDKKCGEQPIEMCLEFFNQAKMCLQPGCKDAHKKLLGTWTGSRILSKLQYVGDIKMKSVHPILTLGEREKQQTNLFLIRGFISVALS